MKTIPVTIGFNQKELIGTMTIDETRLPKTMEYCFAVGGRVHDPNYGDFDLMEVSVVIDENYFAYLKKAAK